MLTCDVQCGIQICYGVLTEVSVDRNHWLYEDLEEIIMCNIKVTKPPVSGLGPITQNYINYNYI